MLFEKHGRVFDFVLLFSGPLVIFAAAYVYNTDRFLSRTKKLCDNIVAFLWFFGDQ